MHRPYYRGFTCRCADCGEFLFDVRTGARLRQLTDIDPQKLAAVERRFQFDPKLAKRLASEDLYEVIATYKFADKYNDFLMNPKARPDLQTPEAQAFLQTLNANPSAVAAGGGNFANQYLNDKTDEMMPWIVREWKKGRVRTSPNMSDVLEYQGHPDYSYDDVDGNPVNWHILRPNELNHWADWYRSDHPSRKGTDIMQMKTPELHQTIKDWDTDMREKAKEQAQVRGDIIHSFPDGWTVQRLTTPEQLADEGEAMGHCVGSYARPVQQGNSLIYSLRDHQNEPHATWEIAPKQWEIKDGKRKGEILNPDDFKSRAEQMDWANKGVIASRPHRGTMEQVQGKGNEPPIPEYQQRIKEYFEHAFPNAEDRPTWEPIHYDDPDYLVNPDDGGYVAYHPGDYGLKDPEQSYDWQRIIDYALGEAGGYNETPAADLTKKAVEHGKFEPFAKEAERQIELGREQEQERMNDAFNHWWDTEGVHNAFEHGEWGYPNEEDFYHPETGQFDQNAFDRAEEEAEKQRDETRDWAYQDWKMNYTPEQPDMHEYMDELEVEIAAQRRREREAEEAGTDPSDYKSFRGTPPQITGSTKRSPHPNFATGLPCYCTFAKHMQHQSVFMDEEPGTCPTCGDPLEHGKCLRCNWGGWSNAMGPGDQNPQDPTKEFHPGIQA